MADILQNMYNKGSFIQCAVVGYHLQMPSDYEEINNDDEHTIKTYWHFLDDLGHVSLQSE